MKPKTLLTLTLVVSIGFVGFKWVSSQKSPRPDPSAVDALSVNVKIVPVQRRDLPVFITTTGHIESKASVVIKSRIDGTITSVLFDEGKPVRKGQPLVRLDPAVTSTQVRQTQALLAKDQSLLLKVRDDLERNRTLASKGFISEAGLSQSIADVDAAKASVNADQAALDNAKLQLGYAQINAPFDGVAGTLQIPIGGTVQANVSPILVVNQMQPIYVSFSVAEAYIPKIRQAMSKGVVSVSAKLANVERSATGKLTMLDNAVDLSTGSIVGKAVFDNKDQMLTPGQFSEITIQIAKLQNVICVPTTAVEDGLDGHYVFVTGADSTAKIRKILTGDESNGFTVVTKGLEAGEQVVVDGQAKLRNASRVNVNPAAN